MDIKGFIEANRERDLCACADYDGLFKVSVGYLSQRALVEARRRVALASKDRHDGPEAAAERFALELAKLVRGWEGLTLGVLARMTNVSLPPDQDPDTPIDCTPANVAALFEEAPGFFEFVMGLATSLEAQRRLRLEEERKN